MAKCKLDIVVMRQVWLARGSCFMMQPLERFSIATVAFGHYRPAAPCTRAVLLSHGRGLSGHTYFCRGLVGRVVRLVALC